MYINKFNSLKSKMFYSKPLKNIYAGYDFKLLSCIYYNNSKMDENKGTFSRIYNNKNKNHKR